MLCDEQLTLRGYKTNEERIKLGTALLKSSGLPHRQIVKNDWEVNEWIRSTLPYIFAVSVKNKKDHFVFLVKKKGTNLVFLKILK
jgi:hypothetical protein